MIEVEDCFDAINKLQRNFHSTIIDKMEQNELFAMAKDWKGQFQYWALSDFEKILDHILQNNKYFPKPSTFWAIKNEIIGENRGETKIVFNCGYCKDTGNRAYKGENGVVHICRCDCRIGINCHKYLPLMSEIKKQGFSEYLIHDIQNPFAFIPQGEGFRLSREIAGENKFMINLLDNAEKRIKQNIAEIIQPEMQDESEELPW